MLRYDTITVSIEVGEDLVQHFLGADLLKLKLFGPRVHDVLEVFLVQHFTNMRLRALVAAVLVGDELDKDGLRARLDHLVEVFGVVRLSKVRKNHALGGAGI